MEPWHSSRGATCPAHCILVPWRDELEWDEVCQELLKTPASASWDKVRLLVTIWRARTALPPAVEALADTTACQQHLYAACAAASENTTAVSVAEDQLRSQRLAAALALSRAVSLLTDRVQQRLKYAQSVGTLADTLGIPPLLVEIRHATVHQAVPSVAALTEAHEEWITFLRARYFIERKRAIDCFQCDMETQLNIWFAEQPTPTTSTGAASSTNAAAERGVLQASHSKPSQVPVSCFQDSFLHSIAYVEVRWLALHLAQRLFQYANEQLRNAETIESLDSELHHWFAQLLPICHRWPHFLPSLVVALVTSAHEAPDRVRRACARMILALLRTLHPSEPTEAVAPWAIAHECFWLEWFIHTQTAQCDTSLVQYCRNWIDRGRDQLHRCAASFWLTDIAPITWQLGPWPRWDPSFGVQRGAWRRCRAWPTCPIGVLPAGYNSAAVHRLRTPATLSKSSAALILEERERLLAQKLVQRTLHLLGDRTVAIQSPQRDDDPLDDSLDQVDTLYGNQNDNDGPAAKPAGSMDICPANGIESKSPSDVA